MSIDPNARYLATHEWTRREGDVFVVGISQFAQESLGDVVYVDLPAVGKTFTQKGVLGVIESVKAANDLYAPLTGTVTEVNPQLAQAPELVNKDPYGEGWLVKIRATDPAQFDALLSADDYAKVPH